MKLVTLCILGIPDEVAPAGKKKKPSAKMTNRHSSLEQSKTAVAMGER
jgi:hypothetical protein